MSLLRHLVKTDFRQFRSVLVIWCGLVVTAATIHGVRPMFADLSRPYELLGLLAVLVWTGGLLVMLGFIAQRCRRTRSSGQLPFG
jgi:putative copper export protein